MRFSFWVGNGHTWDFTLDACKRAEETGWDGIWIADHFMPNEGMPDGPVHEAWTILSALAVAVPRVRLGPLVAGNTYRNPALLAKIVASLDHVSGGRVVTGLGAGWQANEHEAYGFQYESFRWRFDRLEEACQILHSLFAEDSTSFSGDHYQMVNAPLDPKPIQARPPILIGGTGKERTLRIVARYADEWNAWATPEIMGELTEVLEQRCAEVDRDPAEIERSAVALMFLSNDQEWLAKRREVDTGRPTILGTPEEVKEIIGGYQAQGVDEIIIPDFTFRDAASRNEALDLFINEVAPEFR